MASPGLPEDITAGVTTGHVTDHEKIHDLLNEFDSAAQAQATGDLLVFQDGLIKRLPVGSDDQVLTADSTQGAGVAWKTPSGGLPKGVLGYAFRTESITGLTGGPVDLPDLSVQVTVPAGRVIRVVGYVHAWSGAATTGEEANFLIREGDNTLQNKRLIRSNPNRAEGGAVQALILPSAGTHTYKLSFEQIIGSTGWSLIAAPSTPAYILVEDLGADPNA